MNNWMTYGIFGLGALGIFLFILMIIGSIIFIVGVILAIVLPISISNKRYRNFVYNHSKAVLSLNEINKKYIFKKVNNCDYSCSYTDKKMYDNISPIDYLTYELSCNYKDVYDAMKSAKDNSALYDSYIDDIKEKCKYGRYNVKSGVPSNREKLIKIEKNYISKHIKKPVTNFHLKVSLSLTKKNGKVIAKKCSNFTPEQIHTLISKINRKVGNRYLDNDICESISKVETK